MRDKTYDGWTDWKEAWRTSEAAVYCPLSAIANLWEFWWQSNPNPHGWDISLPAKHGKGVKRDNVANM